MSTEMHSGTPLEVSMGVRSGKPDGKSMSVRSGTPLWCMCTKRQGYCFITSSLVLSRRLRVFTEPRAHVYAFV